MIWRQPRYDRGDLRTTEGAGREVAHGNIWSQRM